MNTADSDACTVTATRPSVCPLDCPDTCSLSVSVTDGKITSVRGSLANPYTAGVICDKVSRYYPDFVHGEQRLREPLRRISPRGDGGAPRFEPISWAQAMDLIYEGVSAAIERHGPQTVLPFNYAGPHGQLNGGSMDRRFFHRLGATLLDRGPLCGAVRGTAYTSIFGAAPGMPPEQAARADLVAVWGNNVTVSNLHLARVIKTARENGARLLVVDPKRTRIAEQADLYVQIRPGTDVVLALALAAELDRRDALNKPFIDEWVHGFDPYITHARTISVASACKTCQISEEQFMQLASWYQQAKCLSLSIGNGIERGHSGGSGLRAIMALNVILGHLGRPGAGIIAKPALAVPLASEQLQRPDLIPAGTRTINIVDVGRLLLDDSLAPPIKAVFVYNHNPVCTHPDQNRMRRALSQPDLFVVGCDVVMTDSMQYADVILPASSHFESDDLYAPYGQSYLQRAAPVIAPVAQSKPNTEIFRRLAARFDFDEPLFRETDQQLMDAAVIKDDPRLKGYQPSALPLDEALLMNTVADEPVMMCSTVKPATPSGKVELFSDTMEQRHGYGLPRYEVANPGDTRFTYNLISPSSSRRTNATFGGHADSAGAERLEINPVDATRLGIQTGQAVRVFNDRGEVALLARITDAVAPGVLYSPKGTWLATSKTGQTVNALLDADLRTDIADGACYNDTWVAVEAAA